VNCKGWRRERRSLASLFERHLEHAALVFVLDEELSTHHGVSWADFVLLTVLDAAGDAAPATALARTLRTAASHLLLRLLPLEPLIGPRPLTAE